MSTKRHIYTANKGYADQYKGREIGWTVYTTAEEAIAAGQFDSAETIMQYANAQLNIKKGHAIQAATVELAKDKDGKQIPGQLVNPALSTADMEKLAESTVATKIDRAPKGSGGQKTLAKKAQTTAEKAKDMLASANLTKEKLDTLLELEQIDQATYDAKLAELKAAPKVAAPKAK
jgi:hypothetical protein